MLFKAARYISNPLLKVHKRHVRPVPGTAPGTLTAPRESPPPVIRIMAYGLDGLEERLIENVEELKTVKGKWPVLWVNIDGLGDVNVIAKIGEIFGLHALALEDVLSTHQRPKVDDYDTNIFIVAKMPQLEAPGMASLEQISIFLGKDFVLSFQERSGDCFNLLRDRIRKGGKRVRLQKADYLTYALLDSIVDSYFPVLEECGNRIDDIEDLVILKPTQHLVGQVHVIKRDLQIFRHAVWPLRDAISLLSNDHKLVRRETGIFLRDCQDHVIQSLDILETYRERTSGLTDIYLSSVSNRMNEVMKVLTVISTIFMPLSFIASLYGMNFDRQVSPYNMPELGWYYGYPLALGAMALIVVAMLFVFWRVGWLGPTRNPGAGNE